LWQSVLLPYRPAQLLAAGVRSFAGRAADVAEEVAQVLGAAPQSSPAVADSLRRSRQLAARSRQTIESQFPGVLAPGDWSREQIGRLQLALFTAEQGLGQMVDGASAAASMAEIPPALRDSLLKTLQALARALKVGDAESLQLLARQNEALLAEARATANASSGAHQPVAAASPAWMADAAKLILGIRKVAEAEADVHRLASRARAKVAQNIAPLAPSATPAASPAAQTPPGAGRDKQPQLVSLGGRVSLHPTTVLGLQAVLATGLAMALAAMLNLTNPSWVWWTSFVVIAGSTGETIRKLSMRVLGTVAGVFVGVALAALLPDAVLLHVALLTLLLFLMIYYVPVSYPTMVFFLSVGFVLLVGQMGMETLNLLWSRTMTTVLGSLTAGLVALYILPLHIGDRFRAAAASFLAAVDRYTDSYTLVSTGTVGGDSARLVAQFAAVNAGYTTLERTFPSVAYEVFPFAQAQTALADHALHLTSINDQVAKLAFADEEAVAPPATAALMQRVQANIHATLQATIARLTTETPAASSVANLAVKDTSEVEVESPAVSTPSGDAIRNHGGGLALLELQSAVQALAASLGTPAVASTSSSANMPSGPLENAGTR
ncbi:MAG: FUSC family protein, partial [Caldilineaceae bacterium]